jgi:2-isopropylmalate synthase
MAMNFYSQGVDPRLDLSDMMGILEIYQRSTGMPVHPRHPWAGDLVYAAFSGSHQDAIRKSTAWHRENNLEHWSVAYLPIDPRDLGRRYEEVVRINSQSGKGGVAHVLERDHGVALPQWMLPAVSQVVQKHADAEGEEVSSRRVWELFESEFLAVPEGWQLAGYELHAKAHETRAKFRIVHEDVKQSLDGSGQGLIEALVDAVGKHFGVAIAVRDFDEHAMSPGTEAKAPLPSCSKSTASPSRPAASTRTAHAPACKPYFPPWVARQPYAADSARQSENLVSDTLRFDT